ncbi:GNAT family N-acetyltransferase [Propionibacterium australiense]|nr:GNAT family N-acetyltransferase [Propionibacterium australiense]RLP12017.1 GNAT family N-acetyltransferase [Propionibacterium australiense]RLP12679.1 GNAT family N-acetyltransferase [Propionibacterium australiense]
MDQQEPTVVGDEHEATQQVLRRLRTDVPRDWVLTDRPPVPDLARLTRRRLGHADAGLRVADPGRDAATVAAWMARPHLAETWDQAWSAGQWARDWRERLAGTYSLPLILLYRGDEVGYLEVYRPARDEISRCYAARPHDLGFHIAVGKPELTGKGLFSPLLPILADALIEADPECHLVLVEPDARNLRAHRALRSAGWADDGEVQQRSDRRARLFHWSDRELVLEVHDA